MNEGHKVEELFDAHGRGQFTTYHDTLVATGDYVGVITPVTILEFSDNLVKSATGDPTQSVAGKALLAAQAKEPPGPGADARGKDAVETLTRLNAVPVDQRTFDNPEWVKFLLYDNTGQIRKALRSFIPDDRHAQAIVRLKGNQSIDDEGKAATFAKSEAEKMKFPNASTVTTGASLLLKDINDYLRGGMLSLGAIAAFIMVIILAVLFRVRWRLLPLGVIIVGVIWAFGLAGYIGIPLTIVTIAGLPVMLGVGIDYAIQMHARVEEEVLVGEAEHPIQETARNLCPALLVVTFDAIFAFAALRFAKVPMIRDFGLLLCVGIAAICFGSIIIPLATLGIREFKSPTSRKVGGFNPGYLGRFTEKLGSLPAWSAVPFIIASLVIFFGGLAVEDKLELQTDPIQWVNQSSGTIKDIHELDKQVDSDSEMGVFVRSDDVFSDDFQQFDHKFTEDTVGTYKPPDLILTGASLETSVGDLRSAGARGQAPVGGLLRGGRAAHRAPTGAAVGAASEAGPEDPRASSAADNGKTVNSVFRRAAAPREDRAPLVREVRASSRPPAGRT